MEKVKIEITMENGQKEVLEGNYVIGAIVIGELVIGSHRALKVGGFATGEVNKQNVVSATQSATMACVKALKDAGMGVEEILDLHASFVAEAITTDIEVDEKLGDKENLPNKGDIDQALEMMKNLGLI